MVFKDASLKASNVKARRESKILKAITVLPRDELAELFASCILPNIDDAVFKELYEEAMYAYQPIARKVRKASHRSSLSKKVKAFRESVRRDYSHGYDEQLEMIGDIVVEVAAWLSELFQTAVNQGTDLIDVQRHVMYIEKHMLKVMHTNCKQGYHSYCNGDDTELTITDSAGAWRYFNTADMVIPLFWRDLLLTAIIRNNQEVLEEFQRHHRNANKTQETQANSFRDLPTTLTGLKCYVYTRDPERPEQLTGPDGQPFDDDWFTPSMKAAIPNLLAFLVRCNDYEQS